MSSGVWQDREIRFDGPDSLLQPRPGEVIISHIEDVEDTKGNSGDKGRLYITNLRVIWTSANLYRVNLSIGFKTISKIQTRKVKSNLRGISEAIFLMTSQNKTQFEFIFTSRVSDNVKMFSTMMSVHRAYESSSLYREIIMRGALLSDKELRLLPQEQLYTKLSGVWNLSTDKGNLGTLYITNVRVAWQCKLNDNYNISIPYLQMKVVKVRETKFGVAMVLEGGTLVLGFKVDPYESLKKVMKEIQSLHQVYSACPIFGVEYLTGDEGEGEKAAPPINDVIQEDVELVTTKKDSLAAYLADPHKTSDREPVYSPELGLAIEALPDGYTIADLWQISS